MPNLLSRLIDPWYPATAIGLDKGTASVVQLERVKGSICKLRRAATFNITESLIRPSFDERNIEDVGQLAGILRELATSAGLLKQKRWSMTLPEATARTLVLTMESSQSASELQEVLRWKIERGFSAPLEELSISKDKLQKDTQGRDRYLVIAVKRAVLAEYEAVLESLGWRAGLILPRHLGEAQWLIRNGATVGDSLLLSGSSQGFTGVIFRNKHPLIVRTVNCTEDEFEDEFYRLLLFYRDRSAPEVGDGQGLSRLMVIGEGITKERAGEIVNETTGGDLRPLGAEELGLQLPSRDFSFDSIAAPAGLATLSW
jgi:Tfp pilus assembly PilM family ATPase